MTNIIHSKVKKIYEDSLDLISSPSVKIQIMGGKDVRAKHWWVLPSNVLPLCLKQTFPPKI